MDGWVGGGWTEGCVNGLVVDCSASEWADEWIG